MYRVKVYSNEPPPWSKVEKHSLKLRLCVELCIIYTSKKVTTRHLCIDGHSKVHHAHSDIVPFRVLCVVRTLITWKPLVVPLYVIACAIILRTQSCFKHDKSVECGNTQNSAHPPLWQTCIRCSTHGCSFVRPHAVFVFVRFLLVWTKH